MTTRQQEEALVYFKDHAQDWNRKAASADQRKVNVIEQRNGFVLQIVRSRAAAAFTLDVGCGTGDLVCDIARLGIDATGVDFASEMIDIARAKAEQEKLEKARFCCSSIFDFDPGRDRYDVISANGFIEYISPDELQRFLDWSWQALRTGGSLVLGSRNRLFNIFSANSFTLEEINHGTVAVLLREAIALGSGLDLAELASMDAAPLQQPGAEQTRTGIDVSIRHQYTPAQLARLLKAWAFTVKQVYPVHIHGAPPAFKNQHPEVHACISTLLQSYAGTHGCLVPFASSFMVHAEKAPQT